LFHFVSPLSHTVAHSASAFTKTVADLIACHRRTLGLRVSFSIVSLSSFNQIDLPEYESYEQLRKSLLLAITEGAEGFGFA
jgi:hypothetical protein